MYRHYLEELELRPKTSAPGKRKKNKRKRRNSAPSAYSGSSFTTICYGPDREKIHSSKKDKRILAIESGQSEKPKSANKEGRRSRSGSPKDREKRPKSKSPERKPDEKDREKRPKSKSPERKPDEKERRGTEEEINTAFHVLKVDYHIAENTKNNHTDLFACTEGTLPDLVVRRGQCFTLTITFDRKYEKETHDLMLCFTTGDDPKPPKGTAVSIEMDEDPDGTCENYKEWYAKMVENDKQNCKIKVEITPPSNCIIGEWDFCIETSFRNKPSDMPLIFRYDCKREIIVLLNPWCPHDLVHYPTKDDLEEYILNESGCVYQGNYLQINAKPWDHGQFQQNNLEICLHLIRKYFGYTVDRKMGDPVALSRAISAQVNSSTPGGVLWGNWSGEYEGGEKPWKWKSSTTILQNYFETGMPVKFAQCWVFSAVTTTVCRAIGLPCRSVTNFASAHDTDGSLHIDQEYYYDTEKKKFERISSGDSIWNFHVWNECWMCRPELGKSFDDWQAVDATPQELSDGEYRCGPASICGIKRGEIKFPHDAPFVFAEVNGDICKWERLSTNKWRLFAREKTRVGKCISTKFPDGKPFTFSTERLDLTNEYKFPEGSEEERQSVKNAGKDAGGDNYEVEDVNDVKMYITVKDGALYGSAFDINVFAKNISKSRKGLTLEQRSVDIESSTYDGVLENKVYEKTLDGALDIPYNEEEAFSFQVSYEDYEMNLTKSPYCMEIKVEAVVKETGRTIMEEHPFRLRRPDVLVEAPETTSLENGTFEIKVSFKNPLKKKLTKCQFSVIGNKIDDIVDKEIDLTYLQKDGSWEQKVKLTPLRKGKASITVDFDSDQIQDVEGHAQITIL